MLIQMIFLPYFKILRQKFSKTVKSFKTQCVELIDSSLLHKVTVV